MSLLQLINTEGKSNKKRCLTSLKAEEPSSNSTQAILGEKPKHTPKLWSAWDKCKFTVDIERGRPKLLCEGSGYPFTTAFLIMGGNTIREENAREYDSKGTYV